MIGLVRLSAGAIVLQRRLVPASIIVCLLLLSDGSSRCCCESFSLHPAVPTSPRGPPRHRHRDPREETPSRRRRRRIPPLATFAMRNDDDGSPPPPSSNDDDDDAMAHLRERARWQEGQYAELFSAERRRRSGEEGEERPSPPPESVHLILFHPETPDERRQSVHTIEYPMGSGDNWILAFENGDDCVSFANELRRDNLDYADPNVSEPKGFLNFIVVGVRRWFATRAIFSPSLVPGPLLIAHPFPPSTRLPYIILLCTSRVLFVPPPPSPRRRCSSPSHGIARCRIRASSSFPGGSG